MSEEIDPVQLDEWALRKLYAESLRELRCVGLAKKVENGWDENPRTLAALRMARKLLGLPEPDNVPADLRSRR